MNQCSHGGSHESQGYQGSRRIQGSQKLTMFPKEPKLSRELLRLPREPSLLRFQRMPRLPRLMGVKRLPRPSPGAHEVDLCPFFVSFLVPLDEIWFRPFPIFLQKIHSQLLSFNNFIISNIQQSQPTKNQCSFSLSVSMAFAMSAVIYKSV